MIETEIVRRNGTICFSLLFAYRGSDVLDPLLQEKMKKNPVNKTLVRSIYKFLLSKSGEVELTKVTAL